jgi:hypothetical protein
MLSFEETVAQPVVRRALAVSNVVIRFAVAKGITKLDAVAKIVTGVPMFHPVGHLF